MTIDVCSISYYCHGTHQRRGTTRQKISCHHPIHIDLTHDARTHPIHPKCTIEQWFSHTEVVSVIRCSHTTTTMTISLTQHSTTTTTNTTTMLPPPPSVEDSKDDDKGGGEQMDTTTATAKKDNVVLPKATMEE